MVRPILMLVLLVQAATVWSAAPISEAWRVELPGSIASYEVSELGELLVVTSEGLHGVDPETGVVKWTRPEFPSGVSPVLTPLADSPYYQILANEIMYVLDPLDGKVLFNSLQAGVDAVDAIYFLYLTDNILVKGKSNQLAEAVVVLVDMNTAGAVWNARLDLGKVLSVENLGQDRILVVTLFDIYSIERANGKVAWRVPTLPDLKMTGNQRLNQFMKRFAEEVFKKDDVSVHAVLAPDDDVVYLGVGPLTEAKSTYMALDVQTGENIWSQEMNKDYPGFQTLLSNGILVMPYYYPRDTSVLGGGNRINLLDYRTGESRWGKKGDGHKIKGGVTNVYRLSNGLLLSAFNGNDSYLYVLDPDRGEFKTEKPAEIDGNVSAIYETSSGVLCFTREEINLLDLESGKFQWRKPIESTPQLTVKSGSLIYVFDTNSKTLKSVDTYTGNLRELTNRKLEFEGKEKPASVEVMEEGILICSEQNMALFSPDGGLLYQRHYPAPRRSGWLRALYYAQGVRASIISAQSYYATGSMIGVSLTPEYKEADIVTKSIVTGIAGAYSEQAQYAQSIAAESFRRANQRFKATSVTHNAQLILSEMDKSVNLLKVGKATGEVETTLDLGGDKEPDYAVDPITNRVYRKIGNNMIASYSF